MSGLIPMGKPLAPHARGAPLARGGSSPVSASGIAALDYTRARRPAVWSELHPELHRLLIEREVNPPRDALYAWIETGRQARADGAERETIDLVWATDARVVQVRAHRGLRPSASEWTATALILTLTDARHESRSWVADLGGGSGGAPGPEPTPTDLLPGVVVSTLGNRVVSAVVREVNARGASETLQVMTDHESRAMILRAIRRAARPDQLAEAQWVADIVYAQVAHRERWSWAAEPRSPRSSLLRRLGRDPQEGRPALGSGG
ncbi:MAG: hypothetical protein ACYCTL_13305 [Acidimicrobiales bacterium]